MITLTQIEEEIRNELVDFVKIGDNDNSFVRYKPLAEKFGLPFNNSYERDQLYHILGNISEYEYEHKRPMLSVIVVNDEYKPGKGFFTLARRLGVPGVVDEDGFALDERKRLFDYWKFQEGSGN